MIVVHSLTRIFPGCARPALDEVSFTVEPGHIFGLLGPNGAGKTTLVRILSTLILPTSGTASVCEYDVVHEDSKVRRAIGLAAGGERSFYFRLTGYQNLEFFGGLLGLGGRKLRNSIKHLLDLVGLTDARDLMFMKYSGGMKRKLSLARSLLGDPVVYLFDEPTSGIDPGSAMRIREIIKELKGRGKTVLLTTHNMGEAEKLSDVVGILKEGKLIAVGTPPNLRGVLRERKMVITFSPRTPSAQSGNRVCDLARRLARLPAVASASAGNPNLVLHLNSPGEITPIWIFTTVTSLLSGVLFPVEMLPRYLQAISFILPTTHALRALRLTLTRGANLAEIVPELTFLVITSCLTIPLGFLAFHLGFDKARKAGSLGEY